MIIAAGDGPQSPTAAGTVILPCASHYPVMNFVRDSISETVFAQPPPSHDEAVALNLRRQAGDTEARDLLITGSTRLVARAANRFGSYGVAAEDLFGAGMVGLTKAVDSFNHEKGSFTAWASWHVSIAIADELSRLRYMVALPRRACTDLFTVNRAVSKMTTEEGKQPSLAAISSKTGINRGRVLSLMTIDRSPVQLDAPPPGSGSHDFAEELRLEDAAADPSFQHPGDDMDERERFETLRRHVADLEPKRRKVIELNFGINGKPPMNHREIAAVLNLSPRRISQIAEEAIAQLRGQVAA